MSPHEPLPEPDDQRQLALPEPLCSLVRRCATFCVPECCGLDAFDVNVYVMLTWVKNAGDNAASQASNQLTALIDSLSAHQGPVVSDDDFGTTWTGGSECAAYLRTWLHQLLRARSLAVQGTLSPEQRLAEAWQDSHRAYYLEVGRLTAEAGWLFHTNRAVGLRMFGLIAGLDENDIAISSEVLYSREVVRTNDLYWNVDPKTRAHMIAVCVHRLCRMPIAVQERGNISMVKLIRETDYSALAGAQLPSRRFRP